MPNQNPSGVNQPLNQHPLTEFGALVLGRDLSVQQDLVAGQEYLVVPPPPVGAVRTGVVPSLQGAVQVAIEGISTDAVFELVYRDAAGREIVLDTATILALPNAGGAMPLGGGSASAKYLFPDEGGIYVRFTGGADVIAASVVSVWSDVRTPIGYQDTVLNQQWQDLLPQAPPGLATMFGQYPNTRGTSWVFNYSPGDTKNLVLRVVDADGNTHQVPAAGAPPMAPGATELDINWYLPPGSRLQGMLTQAPSLDGDCVIHAPYNFANQGPVRQDQGGAY